MEIRINSSLHNRVYIVLDVEQNPSQIELPWASEIKVANQPKILLKDTNIITVFDQPDVKGRQGKRILKSSWVRLRRTRALCAIAQRLLVVNN